jgi:hypothetical protein
MHLTRFATSAFALSILFSASLAHAATAGIVNNKTTGKPSAGDTVELIDVQAHMNAAAKTTSDAKGHYTLNMPGAGPYLVRVTHQGAPFFIAAGGPSGDVTVYDARAKVDGVSIEDQIFGLETANGQLQVTEQFVVHNTSSPQMTQFGDKPFEFVLPEGAVMDAAESTRPNGMPTMSMPRALPEKGHYTFTVPIDPDQGSDKMTIFQIQFHLPYSGSYTFKPTLLMTVDNFVIQLPKAMTFAAGDGLAFQQLQRDPSFQIFLLKNAVPGKTLQFTVTGEGSIPREGQQGGAGAAGGGAQAAQNSGPGGGIGEPINQPDPLSKYKWWILGGVVLALGIAAAFLLRKPAGIEGASAAGATTAGLAVNPTVPTTAAGKNAALLNALKEELFTLESEKLSGTIDADEYQTQKAALETVLKRALKRNS